MEFKNRINNHRSDLIRDIDVMDKFHDALFSIYDQNNPVKRKELRKIIKESTMKLEKLNQNNKNKTKL